jgi:hypothetical protein
MSSVTVPAPGSTHVWRTWQPSPEPALKLYLDGFGKVDGCYAEWFHTADGRRFQCVFTPKGRVWEESLPL